MEELKKYALFSAVFALLGFFFLFFFMNAGGRDLMVLGLTLSMPEGRRFFHQFVHRV